MLGILGDQKKKKKQPLIDVNPIEAVRDFSGAVADSMKEDVVKKGYSDLLKQIAQVEEKTKQLHGELSEGQEMDLSQHGEAPKRHDIDPGIDYHREMRHFSERNQSMENRQIDAKLEQIMVELEKLIEESSELETKFQIIAVEQKPVEPGSYHLNFFEWMIGTIQAARQQIEDSSAWLSALQSKKGKKSYWAMFKKHGTSFGMSNERMVATQSG
jgi:hypothetical protein